MLTNLEFMHATPVPKVGAAGTRPYIRALPTTPQQEQSSIGGKGGIKAAIAHALFIINKFDSVPAATSVQTIQGQSTR